MCNLVKLSHGIYVDPAQVSCVQAMDTTNGSPCTAVSVGSHQLLVPLWHDHVLCILKGEELKSESRTLNYLYSIKDQPESFDLKKYMDAKKQDDTAFQSRMEKLLEGFAK